jgi:hypothetical protein
MEPTNDHERAIAEAVDARFREDVDNELHLILRSVVVSLDFAMSASDTQFLVRYVQWRGANPVGP